MVETLDRGLSAAEWQHATFLSMRQGEQAAMQFVQPQFAKVRACLEARR